MGERLETIKKDYMQFCDKEYIFYLENGIKVNLKFKRYNLAHLIGLHKLNDIDVIRQMNDENDYNINPTNIFEVLEQRGIGLYEMESCKSYTTHVKNRMKYFTFDNINSILRKATMFSFIYDKSKTKNDKAKYVLINKCCNMFLHLFIGYDEKYKYYYPNSYVADKQKDSNLDRKTIKINRTEIYILNEKEKKIIEVIDHKKIKEINQMIKDYNSKNKLLYKSIHNHSKEDNTDDMLKDINKIYKSIVKKYNEVDKDTRNILKEKHAIFN